MPNPRNVIAFEGLGAVYATFKIDNSTIVYDATQSGGSAVVGRAVSLSAAGTVALANDNETIQGKLIAVEADLKATVQVAGFMTLGAGTAATLTLGARVIGALLSAARGYVKAIPSAGATYVQADQQNADKGRGMIIDNADTTKVVVQL